MCLLFKNSVTYKTTGKLLFHLTWHTFRLVPLKFHQNRCSGLVLKSIKYNSKKYVIQLILKYVFWFKVGLSSLYHETNKQTDCLMVSGHRRLDTHSTGGVTYTLSTFDSIDLS